jgi:CheY-like chemotaxis protein
MRVLLIDDEEFFRVYGRGVLESAGHEVVVAGDGRDGVGLYRREGADVVVTDLFMPGRDGLELIRELVATRPGVRIVAASGGGFAGRVDLLEVARHLGAAEVRSPTSRRNCWRRPGGVRGLTGSHREGWRVGGARSRARRRARVRRERRAIRGRDAGPRRFSSGRCPRARSTWAARAARSGCGSPAASSPPAPSAPPPSPAWRPSAGATSCRVSGRRARGRPSCSRPGRPCSARSSCSGRAPGQPATRGQHGSGTRIERRWGVESVAAGIEAKTAQQFSLDAAVRPQPTLSEAIAQVVATQPRDDVG